MPDQLQEQEQPLLKFVQASFADGMNQDWSDVYVGEGGYPLAINCDNREGGLKPVRGATLQTGHVAGKLQGIYGFNDYLIMFIAGKLYVRPFNSVVWQRIFPFQMSASVDRIYVQAVPASTFNFDRRLLDANDNTTVGASTLKVGGTEAGLIIQDGINQPWLLKPTLQVVITQRFDQWSYDGKREYVPIGRQMLYAHDILFMVSADGKQLLRSVTARPLDAMVNIDVNGNAGGEASTVSYAVSDETITSLSLLPTGQLLIGTENNAYVVNVNKTERIFGEPTFNKAYTLPSGVVNQFSTFEMLGDYGMIDYDGLRSFNAVSQDKTEARSNIFSRRIRRLIENVTQDERYVCAASANGLIYVHLNTTLGYGILVYDMEARKWISLHQLVDGVRFKQLTVLRGNRVPEIYGITDTNELHLLYSPSADFASATAYTRATTPKLERNYEHMLMFVEVSIDNLDRDGHVTITPIVDNVEKLSYRRAVKIKRSALKWGAVYPVVWPVSDLVSNLTAPFQGNIGNGWKVSAKIAWDCGGQLSRVGLHGNVDTQAVGAMQSGESF